MTSSAPSCLAFSSFASVPAVGMTLEPPRFPLSMAAPPPPLRHFAGDVAAHNVRHRELPVPHAHAEPQVQMVQSASLDLDQDFIRLDLWFGGVFVLQDFRPPVLVKSHRFHRLHLPQVLLSAARVATPEQDPDGNRR